MPVVGPVTRGQDLYWRLLSGQQVLPIQCGSRAYAKRYLEYYNLRAVGAQEVGPLRSGRDQFLQLLMPWQALYYHDGAKMCIRDSCTTA